MIAQKRVLLEYLEREGSLTGLSADSNYFLSVAAIDTSDDEVCRFVTKYRYNFVSNTFNEGGKLLNASGLMQVVVPYSQLYGILNTKISDELIASLKENNPTAYDYIVNNTKTLQFYQIDGGKTYVS